MPEPASECFPGVGFNMPSSPPGSLNNWWCNPNTEYAFMGFSYEVTSCQSKSQLIREFRDIRQRFDGRYVRIYGACDRSGFYNDVVDAAWGAGIGVHALIWFGFNGGNIWKTRRDVLFGVLHSNPRAKFVVRAVQFGSEPLFDWALGALELATQVKSAKASLSSLQIPVTVSEMAYGYQAVNGGMDVLESIDLIDAHMLPFFSKQASTAQNAWPIVQTDLDWFIRNGKGKKIYLSQNGWPSVTYSGVQPNSPNAVANVDNERDYYTLLDEHCSYFKTAPGGGIGWFAHIYSDYQEPGYGIYGNDGKVKFNFNPRTSC
ncbi:glycoside hydrolase superfamily [Cyathus striatus]|nr:glycoside hydrolase superfamily [Cyathus striatus]